MSCSFVRGQSISAILSNVMFIERFIEQYRPSVAKEIGGLTRSVEENQIVANAAALLEEQVKQNATIGNNELFLEELLTGFQLSKIFLLYFRLGVVYL